MPSPRVAGTVATRGFLPQLRVMARSFAEHHPAGRLAVVAADGLEDDLGANDLFDVVALAQLGISERELHRRAMIYGPQGLTGSLWAPLASYLLQDSDSAVLLDADVEIIAPLDDLWELAARHGVLLVPHSLDPLDGVPGAWPEEAFLRAGTFSAGLLAVGTPAGGFLDWWDERGRRDCVLDLSRGLHHEQRWLDLVPALFPHVVLRDRGVNAMVHNVRGRDVEWVAGAPHLAGVPVRLFHYAGYDPGDPDRLCRYFDDDFASLAGRPGLKRLADAYGERLRQAGWPAEPGYRWDALPNGLAVDDLMRELYRDALLQSEQGGEEEPPDPFGQTEEFVEWLRDPVAAGVSRYLRALWKARADLQQAYPEVPGPDEEGLVDWAHYPGSIPAELRPRDGREARHIVAENALARPPQP
jgi:hypothetical protein